MSTEELIIWQEDNPRCLLHILPPKLSERIRHLSKVEPDLFSMLEADLWKELVFRKRRPSETLQVLRLQFWIEYNRAQASMSNMKMNNVYGDLCDQMVFYMYMEKIENLVWLLCPYGANKSKMVIALNKGINDFMEILGAPNFKENGNLDIMTVNAKIKIFNLIDCRLNGMPTQKIDQRTLVADARSVGALTKEMNEQDLLEALKKAKAKELEALHVKNIPELIEVKKNALDKNS